MRLKAFVALAIVVVGLLGGFGVAPVKAQVTIIETQITTNINDDWLPVIYGNRIAWLRGPWYGFMDGHISIYDLSTSTETQITTLTGFPSIYGDRIVYRNLTDIYVYDCPTSAATQITDDDEFQWMPAIYGDRIVWLDTLLTNMQKCNITMYDLSTSTETQITTNTAGQWSPKIYGDRIVWEDYRNGGQADIYMAEVSVSPAPSDLIDLAEEIGSIVANPSQIPRSDFDGATDKVRDNRRNALLNRLDAVKMDIEIAITSPDLSTQRTSCQSAIDQLNSMLEKTDGCSERGTPDAKGSGYTPDWITTCASQAEIDPPIRELIAMLQNLLAQIP